MLVHLSIRNPRLIANLAVAALLGITSLSALGCKSREQEAIEHAQNRKKPGYVRTVNLSAKDVTIVDAGRTVGRIPANSASNATTISAGKRTLVTMEDKAVTADVEVESKMVYTAIIWPDGKMSVPAQGFPRTPEDLTNAWVVAVDRNGVKTDGAAKIVDPSGKTMDVKAGQTLTLMPGEYKTTDGASLGKVGQQWSYTIMLINDGGKVKPMLLLNSDDRKPAAAGTSAT